MPRSKTGASRPGALPPIERGQDAAAHAVVQGRSYFSADADMDAIAEWDVKQDWTVGAVLGVLALGDSIMFGSTKSRDAIMVAVKSEGGEWQRVFIRDAEGWDKLMITLVRASARHRGVEVPD